VNVTVVFLWYFAKVPNQIIGVLPTGVSWLRMMSNGALIKKRGKIVFKVFYLPTDSQF
jgi:hypothetical protein